MAWWTMLKMPGRSHHGPLPAWDAQLAALADELRHHVEHLAGTIGERNALRFPRGLAEAADYIEGQFARFGWKVQRQWYEVSGVACCNLAAQKLGTERPGEIVLLGAHYDSVVTSPGANDNASGVAALLALARRFATHPIGRTLRLVAFVNEEPPCFQTDQMGSRVYARWCREQGDQVVAMLSLETIGYYSDQPGSQKYPPPFGLVYPSTGNFIGFIGNTSSRDLVRQVVQIFRENEPFPCEGAALPEWITGVSFSDQWSFWQEGYPAVMVTDTAMFRYPHYHAPSDTPDKVHYEALARVTRGLLHVTGALLGAVPAAEPPGP